MSTELEARGINVIRALGMDGPHAANSGHQGTAMALAPLAHVLWTRVMKYDSTDPEWVDRDRFILSAGHASILQYSMLHLTGYDLTIDDLKAFRQWDSRTPGHPEAGHTEGIEVTTGPLAAGFGNAVGMAIAERYQRARFGEEIINHHIYTVVGDGCLSEGLSHEAASLAGHLGLGRLICIYDDNHVTIDGVTELALSDNAALRFESYGWDVNDLGEKSEDLDAIEAALTRAKGVEDKPSIIILRSHIGYPSPSLTDSPKAHGLAFGAADITEAKAVMGLPDEPFFVPDDVKHFYTEAGNRGATERKAWAARVDEYDGIAELQAAWGATGLDGWENELPEFEVGDSIATRVASQKVIDALAPVVPGLIGGGADLTGNTGTKLADYGVQSAASPGGRQIYFGVREHAMGTALVGAARHGGVLPFGGTFFVFSDYMRPSIRLAALSGAKAIFIFTHDSVGVGEDGPTHQPVEHLMALRAIPGLQVIRPADATETSGAWLEAINHDGPTAIILSRQNLPVLEETDASRVGEGAYIVHDPEDPQAVIVATGSEVQLALEAAGLLYDADLHVRVVSMPCWDAFERRTIDEQDEVLPPELPTVSVEAGVTLGWERHADLAVGIDRFGASAPADRIMEEFGLTPVNVASAVTDLLDAIAEN